MSYTAVLEDRPAAPDQILIWRPPLAMDTCLVGPHVVELGSLTATGITPVSRAPRSIDPTVPPPLGWRGLHCRFIEQAGVAGLVSAAVGG